MNIEERIGSIMKKMKQLSTKHPQFRCGEFSPKWDAPLPETVVGQCKRES